MVNAITINGPELKREADNSEEFLLLAYYAAGRERNRVSTDIRQMRKNLLAQGETVDAQKWFDAWKKLEALRMGTLIIGRNGKATRFKWNYSLKAIGKAALNGISLTVQPINSKHRGTKFVHDYHDKALVEAMPVPAKPVKLAIVRAEPVKPVSIKTETITVKHVVHVSLRPDYTFEADIPKLTPAEVDQLCAAIKRCV